ncbi:hypothetical protein GWC95_17610 [Sediminibacterium roseum]|uniref:IPT/TIG domain-containing protein n=1 Tax=Sediminibacterium roseum TaxID=1978412 RepID=A0ABW9ZX56_9BACT|nr:IPT/TIG domain-containing protein [Sediminibacterium roseum]NCI51746.1 hypothetical protein [Sediminibacterium roseum]
MKTLHTAKLCAIGLISGIAFYACEKSGDSPAAPLAPTVNLSFTPQTATADDTVMVKGTGFTGATACSFGGANAKSFSVLSDTVIMAVINANTPSGPVVVNRVGSSAMSAAGFTYYTPIASYLLGSAKYTTLNKVIALPRLPSDSALYKEFTAPDTASFVIRAINPNNTEQNKTAVGANLKPPIRSRYADSANYVIMTGVMIENDFPVTNYNGYVYRFRSANMPARSSVFAKITDTLLTIPAQYPLDGYITISGSGVIKNGVVVSLDYFVNENFGNTKRASLRKP